MKFQVAHFLVLARLLCEKKEFMCRSILVRRQKHFIEYSRPAGFPLPLM